MRLRLPRATNLVVRLLGFCAVAVPLAGQQQPDSTRADSVARARARRAATLAPVVVAGSRLRTLVDTRTPARIDALELGQHQSGPAALSDALERLPGVSSGNDQGTSTQPTLDVRGFPLSPVVGVPQGVSVFLDGVRINEPDAQEVHFDLVPMDAVARAELVRGPAVLFGKNTLGGALNLVTRRGDATPPLTIRTTGGSFGYRAAHVTAAGVHDGIDGLLLAGASGDDGYRHNAGTETRQLFATVGRRREHDDVALSVLLARDAVFQAGSLPESWLDPARRANYTGGDVFRPQLTHVALRFTHDLATDASTNRGTAQLRGNLFARRNAIEQFNANVSDADTRAFITNRSLGGTAEYSVPARLGALPLNLTVGGEYAHSMVDYRLLAEPNAAAPSVPDDCEVASGLCEDAGVNGDDGALYAQALLQATTRATVLLAARGDVVRVPFRDHRDPANNGTNTFRRISPRLGLDYQISPSLRSYASLGSGFRAPAALELACASADAPCPLPFSLGADPPLRPVVAWSGEVGLHWRPRAGTRVELAAFRTVARNEIAFVSAGTAAGYFQNVPRTRRDGLEASAELPVTASVRLSASYAWLDATYRSPVELASALGADVVHAGDRLALSPRHRASLGIRTVRALGRTVVTGGLTARGVSSQRLRGAERADLAPLPGYAVADLELSATRGPFTLAADVENLLDRRYVVYGTYAENPKGSYGGRPPAEAPVERFLTPALPRHLSISLTWRR